MNALIIYHDFASAAKANAALQHAAQCSDVIGQWNISPWRMDMLKFPPTAEEALTDAAEAHLIVFAGRSAQLFPFWLEDWLERWARNRQIEDVALAVIREAGTDPLSIPVTPELSAFAARHGLNFIFDCDRPIAPSPIEDRWHEHAKCPSPIRPPNLDTKTREAYQGWSITERETRRLGSGKNICFGSHGFFDIREINREPNQNRTGRNHEKAKPDN